MPSIELTNEEYDRIMRERQPEHVQRTGYCEDYPCCGHTPDDPCGYQSYDNPHRMAEWAQAHSYCDHEAGIYECEDRYDDGEDYEDPRTCEHGDTTENCGVRFCDWCGSELKVVTDVSPLMYESKVVPGLWMEIRVLGWHYEAA